jgi:cysteine synthase
MKILDMVGNTPLLELSKTFLKPGKARPAGAAPAVIVTIRCDTGMRYALDNFWAGAEP